MVQVYSIPTKKKKSIFSGGSVNSLLILVNVIAFILWAAFGEQFILSNIAISLENIANLKLWTFLTSMFMHGGLFHLFVNMLSLFFIGSLVERILGPKRYFYFYMASGLFAGLLYILVELFFTSNLPAVGASGALFGLIGFLMLITPDLPVYVMFIPIPIKMKYAAPGILIVLWLISIAGNIPIGNTAHLGGLISGLVYGGFLRKKYKNKARMLRRHFS